MQPKLQELTEKIFQEGVERGNQEAGLIIAKAREEAGLINKKAIVEAERIIEQANQKASEIQSKAQSEVKLAGRQVLNALKQEITGLVLARTLKTDISKAFEDSSYIRELILAIIQKWEPGTDGNISLNLVLPANKETELRSYIETKVKSLLSKGLVLQFSGKLKNGFEIGPADGSYKISFTDDDFNHFFIDFVKPAVAALLFEGDK